MSKPVKIQSNIVALLVSIFGFLVTSVGAQEINLEQDLVARYLFEGNARNQVEDSNHGIETNVIYAIDRYGQPNHCLYLTGDNSFVTIPHTEDLNWDARMDSYSICFWVKSQTPTHGSGVGSRVLTKWIENVSSPYPFSFQYSDEILHLVIYNPDSGPLLTTLSELWDDTWHHVAFIYSHVSTTLNAYLDAKLIHSSSLQMTGSTKNNGVIYIGRTLTAVLEGFYRGNFDDLYFYDRAIEACEIEALYSGDLLEER